MGETCWFCLESLRQNNRPVDRHHKTARRYLSTPEKRDRTNVVLSHCDCHCRFHRTVDDVRQNRQQYARHMQAIEYGYGIFAQADAMAAN